VFVPPIQSSYRIFGSVFENWGSQLSVFFYNSTLLSKGLVLQEVCQNGDMEYFDAIPADEFITRMVRTSAEEYIAQDFMWMGQDFRSVDEIRLLAIVATVVAMGPLQGCGGAQ